MNPNAAHPMRWLVIACVLVVAACASLPPLDNRETSTAFTDTAQTRLGLAVAAGVAAHPGKTGVHALPEPHDAFATRVLLARAAERSIDAQYFIWHDDQVGAMLFEALWRAAERGVRVRLLLDDINTRGLDPTLAALDAHPNIEVRLYNPLAQRSARALGFVTDFTRVNRRMHNKSFIVDNQVSVVGGRNIGNEYFAAGEGIAFTDLDVVAVGSAVADVSKEFDLYWNSASAYPAAIVLAKPPPNAGEALQAGFASTRDDPQATAYVDAVARTPLVRDLLERRLAFEWTTTELVYDDPAKTLDESARTDLLLFPQLVRALGRPEKRLDLVSPYFVPGDGGTAALAALAGRGIDVRVLTNSLAASDERSVHAGYAKRRVDLLHAGVHLYELKPTVSPEVREERSSHGGSSTSALHAKTYAVDGARIFVGSFNFDQRSAHLNTEMGLVIDSPALARRLDEAFDRAVRQSAYEVRLAADGHSLEWIERTASGETRYDVEPQTTWYMRSLVEMLSMLPIEWLL